MIAIVALSCMGLTATAQERAAGSALDTQMTWSSLSTKVKSTQTYAEGVNAKIEQAIVCGKQNRLYAPAAPGANSQGCKDVDISSDPSFVSLQNTVNSLKTTVTQVNTTVTNMKTNVDNSVTYNGKEQVCTAQGYVYAPGKPGADGNGCLKPTTGRDCTMDRGAACGRGDCLVRARYPFGSGENYTQVPTTWKDGDTYIWKYTSTNNDYGGAQCKDGTLKYFATGN